MEGKTIGIIAVVIVVILGGWFLLKGTPANAPTTTDTTPPADITTTTATTQSGVTVTYTDQGFSPANVAIPLGTSVTFVNQSSGNMWVASAMHPTHTAYSGTSLSQHCPDTAGTAFDECAATASGSSYTFVFNKAGTWKYHNHLNISQFGAVTVTAAN
ncbi:hypothetical protein A3I46_02550 [Candidatus Kaiserbacteria bacterium RIFCSPLOWO2_02_FULL_54_13]|uniref:Blue (type 1) copper domain-containing protein n=1 Tax=Candidatus Kaiserbacteria bacterium RIFCSPHIGHO2_02_FULL_54_22 TaxID=1798495 RepID=A0A1F6DKY1_9BACT|nr:MAG: hypothetical protein A3C19_00140 [Candidatus Kaiserbacteria bacterium RIFCSPHIGHO2_02_FULL_54_22]OGG67944.1 MAG: hypothetical protein A3E99_01250 [Candidatus Kaiserbacteria bacterium RIFCSPHIGHO2_12_FULL_54_16]OGG82934.1 MAG: hypothetical protein A3I46_02550 [Candidatus Kaiserbacteria bacterium RIFCSPLOWO2_02_FULL_54_13]OGG90306.1 MAG: hypothetical protein A3G12_01630 [Candidatus Kaiserbacteria bacterium RIFCSPLOWO2_12_FULL_54_10]